MYEYWLDMNPEAEPELTILSHEASNLSNSHSPINIQLKSKLLLIHKCIFEYFFSDLK